MKFIALTLLSLASLVSAQDQHFTVGLNVAVDHAIGDPNNPKCTAAIESTFVAAYAAAYPDSDVKLESVTFTDVSPSFFETDQLQVGTMGRWTYVGSGDNSCNRCNPLAVTFASKGDLLEAVGTTDAFEAKLLSMLQALNSNDCNSFKKITDVNVEWIRDGANELEAPVAAVVEEEQHFTVGLNVAVDHAIGDPNNSKCTAAIESTFVAAYAAAYPDSDVKLESVTFNDVSPSFLETDQLQVGTMGRWTYVGSGDNSCNRCNPLAVTFASKGDLLEAIGTTDAFEAKLLSMLQALKSNDCNSFKKISDVTVSWIRNELEAAESHKPEVVKGDEQHFTVGLNVAVDHAIGDPNNSKCTAAIESTFVAAYAAAYPDSDVKLESVTFTDVSPGYMISKMLRVATTGRWTYVGSGDNSCNRCNPIVSANFIGKEDLLKAVGTSDAFEAKLLSMLQALKSSDCNSFKKITDVTVTWVRSSADELSFANA